MDDLAKLLMPRLNKYIKIKPHPKQALFLSPIVNQIPEVFFGGAASGGKSSAALAAALQFVDLPGYNALILRRTFRQLQQPGGMISKAHEWLQDTDATWSEQKHQWVFPSGSTLTFGHMENEAAKYDYQGAEYHAVIYEELTQYTEAMYRYLFSRMRKNVESPFPIRMRATGNPGGLGHDWVYSRFILPESQSAERMFIPATLDDNPSVDREEYEGMLALLDPVEQQQLRYGNWDVRAEGSMFKSSWFADNLIDRDKVPNGVHRVRYWDTAATEATAKSKNPDYLVGVLMSVDRQNNYYVEDVQRLRAGPHDVENTIRMVTQMDGTQVPQYLETEPGSMSKIWVDHMVRELNKYTVIGTPVPRSNKEVRARALSAKSQAGHVYLIRAPWNSAFVTELGLFPQKGVHDDQVDAAAGALTVLSGSGPMDIGGFADLNAQMLKRATAGQA